LRQLRYDQSPFGTTLTKQFTGRVDLRLRQILLVPKSLSPKRHLPKCQAAVWAVMA
jgi:hypothetical protein